MAVPYPVLLVTEQGEGISISLAHKRYSFGAGGKVVLEELNKTTPLMTNALLPVEADFLASLALSTLPSRDMLTLYQGWIDRVVALEVTHITEEFTTPATPEEAAALHDGLETYARLTREVAVLHAQAKREKQLNRRVELNLQIKRLETEITTIYNMMRRDTV